jgi:hypothetical protein
MWWLKRAIAAVVAALLCLTLPTPPSANAAGRLVVGMPISIGGKACSLGFFGFNVRGDRMAVTAGHCSRAVGEVVYASGGIPIGLVVSRLRDAENAEGKLTGSRGYTLIGLHRRFSVQPLFANVGAAAKGDRIAKVGRTTGKTFGKVTLVRAVEGRPDMELVVSNILQRPGDSGSPWAMSGPTLVGLASSGRGDSSHGQPVLAVIDMIRSGAGIWGRNFKVWLQ